MVRISYISSIRFVGFVVKAGNLLLNRRTTNLRVINGIGIGTYNKGEFLLLNKKDSIISIKELSCGYHISIYNISSRISFSKGHTEILPNSCFGMVNQCRYLAVLSMMTSLDSLITLFISAV